MVNPLLWGKIAFTINKYSNGNKKLNIIFGNMKYNLYLRQMRLTDKPYDLDQSYKIVNLTVEWCKKFFTAQTLKDANHYVL